MTIRRFYSSKDRFDAGGVWLDADETRHLRDVLRLKPDDVVQVFDGEGCEFECRIDSVEKRRSHLIIIKEIAPASPESTLDLTIAVTLLKGEKLDLVVQKAVELGVNRLIPMDAARCDVKTKDSAKRIERWRRIAMEATKQCGRAKLMGINELTQFQSLIDTPAEVNSTTVLFSERDGGNFESIVKTGKILAFFGPEGGWDDRELDAAIKGGVQTITFGGRVMKADTAAIAISSILQNKFGDMN